MKKVIKNPIFTFIVGIVLATSVTTVALSVVASDVAYDNTNSGSTATTMQGAIDDLYDKAENMPKGVKVVTLGTGTSYNIKTLYPDVDYTKLTTANFYYRIAGVGLNLANGGSYTNFSSQSGGGGFRTGAYFTAPSISYNAETGVLTCGNGTARAAVRQINIEPYWYHTATVTTTCYMVYAE